MFIKCMKVGQEGTNCYILCDKVTNKAAVIDPGFDSQRIIAALADIGCEAEYVLLTHGHYDHIGAVEEVLQKTGAKLAVPEAELDFLNNPEMNLSNLYVSRPLTSFKTDILLRDGETLKVGTLDIQLLHTPGHTPGSSCIICQDTIFSGDTLFKEDVGRTDLPGGSSESMRASIQKLASLQSEYQILPGHGEFTTLTHEKQHNPYFNVGE